MGLTDVKSDIVSACKAAERAQDSVTLVAVSKFQTADKIEKLLKDGQRVFGENRVQEAEEKYPALRKKYSDIHLHFIGHLQTNKVKNAVALFDVIETVDRPELAAALRKEMDKQNRDLPCFIQVNTGEEPQKGGVAPKALPALYQTCKDLKLNVVGLMCIPPADEIPDLHFALLHKLADDLDLKQLSMGMSADFQTAIKYGATHVRVGTALFGNRQQAA